MITDQQKMAYERLALKSKVSIYNIIVIVTTIKKMAQVSP